MSLISRYNSALYAIRGTMDTIKKIRATRQKAQAGGIKSSIAAAIGQSPKRNPLPRKSYTGLTVTKSMSPRQIRRGIVRHEIKSLTRDQVKNTGSRVAAARNLRAMRKAAPGYTRKYLKLTSTNPTVKKVNSFLQGK